MSFKHAYLIARLCIIGCLTVDWPSPLAAQQPTKSQGGTQTSAVGPQPQDAPAPDDDGVQMPAKGGKVDSNQGPGGQKHFVSPKKAGDVVTLRAQVPHDLDSKFETYFEWVKPRDPEDSTKEVGTAHGSFFDVPRDKPGKYTVEVRTKSTGTVATVDKINVWIVWAVGTMEQPPHGTMYSGVVTSNDTTESEGVMWSASATDPTDGSTGAKIRFDVQPIEITDKTQDIPDLTETSQPSLLPVPPKGIYHLLQSTKLLSGGAKTKWDISQRMQVQVLNPSMIPYAKLPDQSGSLYVGQPVASKIVQGFPDQNWTPGSDDYQVIGNDDFDIPGQDSDVYAEVNHPSELQISIVNHPRGSLALGDLPNILIASIPPNLQPPNNVFVVDYRFGTFVRLQIGRKWYRISDDLPWHHRLKAVFRDGTWHDNGSSSGPGHPSN